jgi:hypothetical protein
MARVYFRHSRVRSDARYKDAMRTLIAGSLLLTFAATAAEPGSNIHLTPGPKRSAELTAAIRAADLKFFHAFFDTCDVDTVAAMVTDDLEFFHDKQGYAVKSGADFVEGMKKKCERQKTGEDFLSKRVLVEKSLEVFPLEHYGAVETGRHRFYAVIEGQPDRLTEDSQFTQVWKNENGTWKLARVLSYDHQLAPQPD